VKLKRHGAVLAMAAVSALVLSACGSDPNAGGGSGSGGSGGNQAQGANANCGGKPTLAGEGSSAQNNAMAVFIQAYQKQCDGFNVAYNPTGSGAGRKQFAAGLVDFGGSDAALKPEEEAAAAKRCQGNPAWNIPLVFGPVAIAYKLGGVDDLVLNAETTAKIFNGQIKTWNDPAIAALNQGKQLPATPITVVYRSDDSGTTENFQKYLTTASKGAWTQGTAQKFSGGVGEGREKSAGVAQAVGQGDGAITYVELSFAQDNQLSMAKIDNGSGPVELNADSTGKAIEGAKIAGQGNDLKLDINSIYGSTQPGTYPLLLATYEIVCSKGYQPDVAQAVKSFMSVAAGPGQDGLAEAGYVKLPDSFKQKVTTAVQAIG
jgi:phosphate transport system substrate-binding protein